MRKKWREWVQLPKDCSWNNNKRKILLINFLRVTLSLEVNQLSSWHLRRITNNSEPKFLRHCTQVLLHTELKHSSKSSPRIFLTTLILSKLRKLLNTSKQCSIKSRRMRRKRLRPKHLNQPWKEQTKPLTETTTLPWLTMLWVMSMKKIMEKKPVKASKEKTKLIMISCENENRVL